MKLTRKNISHSEYMSMPNLANGLNRPMEEKKNKPAHTSIIDDLKEAVGKNKLAELGKIKLQSALALINEL